MPLDRVWTPAEVEEQSIFEAEASLHFFVQLMWKTVEPKRKFVDGWLLRAMCEHLEGVADGRMKRLIINVPPGSMKSLLTNCFFPAWLWGPKNRPHLRFITDRARQRADADAYHKSRVSHAVGQAVYPRR
jgi:hypothetical protein